MGPYNRSRHCILPLTLILNLCLNLTFLAYTGTIRLPLLSNDVKSVIINDSPLDLVISNPINHPPYATQPTALSRAQEPVVFAMVMYGTTSATEGLLALKSALMHISRPVVFHIICSPDAVDIIQSKLNLFSRYCCLFTRNCA